MRLNLPKREFSERFCRSVSEALLEAFSDSDPVLATIHGSFLYGTAHKESDLDLYVVTEQSARAKQVIDADGHDVVVVGMGHFLESVAQGGHQAVEALCSPHAAWNEDSSLHAMLARTTVPAGRCAETWQATAQKFRNRSEAVKNEDVARKLRHHAGRLDEMAERMFYGRYSPVWKPFKEVP